MIGNLIEPEKPDHIPLQAQWLRGEGAGVWFHISKLPHLKASEYRIIRYGAEGDVDCDRIFTHAIGISFDINSSYQFTYLSHCQLCTILQDKKCIIFEFVKEFKTN